MARAFSDTESAADDPLHDIEVGSDDLDPRILRAARLAAEAALNRMPQQHNYGRINSWGPWVRWAIGLAILAIGATLGNYLTMQSEISAIQQSQTDMRQQVAQIYQWLAPTFRDMSGTHGR